MRLVLAALWFAPLMWSAKPVWIDTDPSAIPGGHEVDDAFALLQAFGPRSFRFEVSVSSLAMRIFPRQAASADKS